MLYYCTTWRVASLFFREPTRKRYLLELSRALGLAHTSVKRHLQRLLDDSIITTEIEERGTRRFPYYRAARDTPSYQHYKRLYNLDSLQGLVRHLADQLQPDVIILFGSYARGEDDEESDIDLYLQCRDTKLQLTEFEHALGRRIQLHLTEHLGNFPETLQENIRNGITLYGTLWNDPSPRTLPKHRRSGKRRNAASRRQKKKPTRARRS